MAKIITCLAFMLIFCLTACNQEKPAEKTANPTEATTEAATESSESVETEAVKKLTVGDTYFYGSYEQDNDTSNGKESIEWIVLDVQEDKALLISKYVLDCQQYYENFEDITWEKSDLRQWLNNDFLNTAFSNEEITQIVLTTVKADQNPNGDTDAGNETSDYVFLLSGSEAETYFSYNDERACKATEYAVANGVFVYEGNGNVIWWLRTPGYCQSYVSDVRSRGNVEYNGSIAYGDNVGVRPVLWVSI